MNIQQTEVVNHKLTQENGKRMLAVHFRSVLIVKVRQEHPDQPELVEDHEKVVQESTRFLQEKVIQYVTRKVSQLDGAQPTEMYRRVGNLMHELLKDDLHMSTFLKGMEIIGVPVEIQSVIGGFPKEQA